MKAIKRAEKISPYTKVTLTIAASAAVAFVTKRDEKSRISRKFRSIKVGNEACFLLVIPLATKLLLFELITLPEQKDEKGETQKNKNRQKNTKEQKNKKQNPANTLFFKFHAIIQDH